MNKLKKYKVVLIDSYDHEKVLKAVFESKYAAKSAANKQIDNQTTGAVDYRIEEVS